MPKPQGGGGSHRALSFALWRLSNRSGSSFSRTSVRADKQPLLKGLILAQNERWRRGLGMQVERIPGGLLPGGSGERGSKAWVTYPGVRHSRPNGRVIPGDVTRSPDRVTKGLPPWEGPTWY